MELLLQLLLIQVALLFRLVQLLRHSTINCFYGFISIIAYFYRNGFTNIATPAPTGIIGSDDAESVSPEAHFTIESSAALNTTNQPGKERIYTRFKLPSVGERLRDSNNVNTNKMRYHFSRARRGRDHRSGAYHLQGSARGRSHEEPQPGPSAGAAGQAYGLTTIWPSPNCTIKRGL
jgi:hypothetical protein